MAPAIWHQEVHSGEIAPSDTKPERGRQGILVNTDHHEQFHKTSAKMRDANPSAPGGIALGNFDGIADFYVRSYEEFTKAFEDPYYLEVVRPDEEKFVDMDSIVVTIGYEHVVFETDDFNESNKPEGA